MQDLMMLLGSV